MSVNNMFILAFSGRLLLNAGGRFNCIKLADDQSKTVHMQYLNNTQCLIAQLCAILKRRSHLVFISIFQMFL